MAGSTSPFEEGGAEDSIKSTIRQNYYEKPATVPSFYKKSAQTTPDIFISQAPFDSGILKEYALCNSPKEVQDLYADKKEIGNAVDLSTYILMNKNTTDNNLKKIILCNWNLDGDRGYGYKCWDGVPPTVYLEEINPHCSNSLSKC